LNHHKKGIKVERRKLEMNQCGLEYIYMEMSQGNSLYSYLKQKCHFFSFTKSENRMAENRSCLGGEGWYQWELGGGGERMWEDEYSINTVYTCM
jgi:hypothetical protein